MINYKHYLLGRQVEVVTQDNKTQKGRFEGIQILGPKEESLFVAIKLDEDRIVFIPERLVERIYLVEKSGIPGENGEGF